jgi:hypothetical protein
VPYSYVLKQAQTVRGLLGFVWHGEAVEPVVVKCNVATRQQTTSNLIAYLHMDFSRVIKIKMESRSV